MKDACYLTLFLWSKQRGYITDSPNRGWDAFIYGIFSFCTLWSW